jgi:hypothetical protein
MIQHGLRAMVMPRMSVARSRESLRVPYAERRLMWRQHRFGMTVLFRFFDKRPSPGRLLKPTQQKDVAA